VRSLILKHSPGIPVPPFHFFYSSSDHKPSAIRLGPWKMHVRIYSQTGNNYGFAASREKPLLFQVEQDLSERIDRAHEEPGVIRNMEAHLNAFEKQAREEGTFWALP